MDNFVCDLRKLTKSCNFGNMEERLLRDQIVLGAKNDSLRTKLLETKNLTLANTLGICRVFEMSQQQNMAMKTENEDMSAIRENKKEKAFRKKETMLTKCKYCGKQHKRKKEECPAFAKTCLNCKGRNHFSTVRRAPKKKQKVQKEVLFKTYQKQRLKKLNQKRKC